MNHSQKSQPAQRTGSSIQQLAASQVWTWPRPTSDSEANPDFRLLGQNVAGVQVAVTQNDSTNVVTQVRTITQHDLVLVLNDASDLPLEGQVVEITMRWENWDILKHRSAIVHWAGDVDGQRLVALFMVEPLGEVVERWESDRNRLEVRFPSQIPGLIEAGRGRRVSGTIIDYSLSGCRFLTTELFELDVALPLHVCTASGPVQLSLRAHWALQSPAGFQVGCGFLPEQGVLLAVGHHAASESQCTHQASADLYSSGSGSAADFETTGLDRYALDQNDLKWNDLDLKGLDSWK